MINFSDISIIIHCRIDNEERGKNAKLVYDFYNSNTINSDFIFVEDDIESKLFNYIPRQPNVQHIVTNNEGNWEKTICYNKGAKLSTRKYFYFLDLDVIVHPKFVARAVEQFEADSTMGIVLGYNGQSMYLTYEAKALFENAPTYNTLECFIPREWLYNGELLSKNLRTVQDHVTEQGGTSLNKYTYCTAPNSQAVGGSVITSAKKFFEYKGFNPNFKGWGYEDNEIVIRVHRLGHTVTRISDPKALLFHFPHDPEGYVDKTNTSDHIANHKEVSKIEYGSEEEMLERIKSWNV